VVSKDTPMRSAHGMSGIRVVGGIASGVIDLCGDHSTCFRRVGVGSRV